MAGGGGGCNWVFEDERKTVEHQQQAKNWHLEPEYFHIIDNLFQTRCNCGKMNQNCFGEVFISLHLI